jgi:hypothetical protein
MLRRCRLGRHGSELSPCSKMTLFILIWGIDFYELSQILISVVNAVKHPRGAPIVFFRTL